MHDKQVEIIDGAGMHHVSEDRRPSDFELNSLLSPHFGHDDTEMRNESARCKMRPFILCECRNPSSSPTI